MSVLADHLRLPLEDTKQIAGEIVRSGARDAASPIAASSHTRGLVDLWVERLAPGWKKEAVAAVKMIQDATKEAVAAVKMIQDATKVPGA